MAKLYQKKTNSNDRFNQKFNKERYKTQTSETCPHCGSESLEQRKAPAPHHAALYCLDCESWIKWLPKRDRIHQSQQLRKRVARLYGELLSGWDRIFINSLQKQSTQSETSGRMFRLSPKQLVHLERIERELGVKAPPDVGLKPPPSPTTTSKGGDV